MNVIVIVIVQLRCLEAALGEEGAGDGSENRDDELNDSFPIDFFH